MSDTMKLEFKQERYGAEVATVLENDEAIVEVMRMEDGEFQLTIHNRGERSNQWDDLSAVLTTKHFAELARITGEVS